MNIAPFEMKTGEGESANHSHPFDQKKQHLLYSAHTNLDPVSTIYHEKKAYMSCNLFLQALSDIGKFGAHVMTVSQWWKSAALRCTSPWKPESGETGFAPSREQDSRMVW